MSYVMSLDIESFLLLVNKAAENRQEEALFNRWGYELPVTEKPISWEEYRKKYLKTDKKKIDKTDNEKLKQDIRSIVEKDLKRKR